uniref:Uncharacterized protein n=1 Tax=Anopheles minimus TaxID=112268 RepID=A0A182WIU2_9DIPT
MYELRRLTVTQLTFYHRLTLNRLRSPVGNDGEDGGNGAADASSDDSDRTTNRPSGTVEFEVLSSITSGSSSSLRICIRNSCSLCCCDSSNFFRPAPVVLATDSGDPGLAYFERELARLLAIGHLLPEPLYPLLVVEHLGPGACLHPTPLLLQPVAVPIGTERDRKLLMDDLPGTVLQRQRGFTPRVWMKRELQACSAPHAAAPISAPDQSHTSNETSRRRLVRTCPETDGGCSVIFHRDPSIHDRFGVGGMRSHQSQPNNDRVQFRLAVATIGT